MFFVIYSFIFGDDLFLKNRFLNMSLRPTTSSYFAPTIFHALQVRLYFRRKKSRI